MREWARQSHVKWYCRYHVVFAPKYRKKVIYGKLRRELGGIIRQLCQQNKIEIIEGHAMIDHVHLCLSIPPKYSVANTIGFVKGKSAIRIHREYLGRRRNFTGFHFWARGYCVSTVGLDEQTIRDYIRHQEEEEKREEQLSLLAPRVLPPVKEGSTSTGLEIHQLLTAKVFQNFKLSA